MVAPLKKVVGTDSQLLTSEEIEEVFANVEEIVTFHKAILSVLESRMANFSSTSLVGDLFVKKVCQFISSSLSLSLSFCCKKPFAVSFRASKLQNFFVAHAIYISSLMIGSFSCTKDM